MILKPHLRSPAITATELGRAFAAKTLSPVDHVRDTLRRVHEINSALNIFYHIDDEGALSAARRSEERWSRGEPLGPLDGVPTSIKDALLAVGWTSHRGSSAATPIEADQDAPAVARMREAGMVFLGKTTMPDFGILSSGTSSQHGITRNPVNPAFTPGGSSSGTAASIAADLNPVAIGTDIVGSIRLPASFCGIFGLKPSQGRVPYYFPNSPSLVAGPMARTVEDAALLLDIVARPDPRDFTALPPPESQFRHALDADIDGARISVYPSLGFGFEPDETVLSAVERVARFLEANGFALSRRNVIFSPDDLRQAERFYKVRCRTELRNGSADRRSSATVIDQWSAEAETMSAVDFYAAFNRLQNMRERAAALLDNADFILLPTVPAPAFRAELPGFTEQQIFQPWINTFLFNLTEQPASSIPCGMNADGLPIGVQVVGRRWDDIGVLRLSRLIEGFGQDGAD